ncbi:hypothetical protein IEQ34_005477 [Dendrobium chrysotoxum]|uniref:Uncharacterized protein n=1 Tax=Dendrobium chrysotoxum TaxID=161865 RepID=A0AAV7GV39_DENCH|nr:hypothetical protein IEQ34_005477 [Dendrobium chrysotoxum]
MECSFVLRTSFVHLGEEMTIVLMLPILRDMTGPRIRARRAKERIFHCHVIYSKCCKEHRYEEYYALLSLFFGLLRAHKEWWIAEDGLSTTIEVEEDGLLTTINVKEDGLSTINEAMKRFGAVQIILTKICNGVAKALSGEVKAKSSLGSPKPAHLDLWPTHLPAPECSSEPCSHLSPCLPLLYEAVEVESWMKPECLLQQCLEERDAPGLASQLEPGKCSSQSDLKSTISIDKKVVDKRLSIVQNAAWPMCKASSFFPLIYATSS